MSAFPSTLINDGDRNSWNCSTRTSGPSDFSMTAGREAEAIVILFLHQRQHEQRVIDRADVRQVELLAG